MLGVRSKVMLQLLGYFSQFCLSMRVIFLIGKIPMASRAYVTDQTRKTPDIYMARNGFECA